ncbi:MAG: asparagine synthase (glutamine-hydrolyzing) [Chthoniobacterales bacterium]|nr:asparagine synthase (glutamine-hydrolyzing) [Chthoniobacterales bacterium]
MCGICGQLNFGNHAPVEATTIRRMAQSIAHRGPDDEGYFVSGSIGLGFRRLSIIDLAGGHQPMFDAEQSVSVIFNGEIYNYKELREQLQQLGCHFRTASDTEVIVHGYKEWGTDVFNRLNGMFGLAIWDVRKKRLVVARDAMGIKLVYYRITAGVLTFGSEVRAVVAADKASPEVDSVALDLFLRFRYTPSPLTIFRGIRKLAPGSMLIVEEGECRRERWYNYAPVPFAGKQGEAEAIEELLELYRAAVKRHLLSDVPVGLLLSGGLDSGLLLALMNEQGGPWPAYTIGYGNSYKDDELSDAAETARLLGARHITVQLDQREFVTALPRIVESLEEPVASSSVVPMYFISQRARQDVKVVLIGQGPDELFGGYKRHLGVHYGGWWRALPRSLRSPLGSAMTRLPRNETLKRGIHSLGIDDRLQRYQHVFSIAPGDEIKALFREDALPESEPMELVDYWRTLLPQMEHLDELGGFQLIEIRSSLPDELLMYADKLSMAHSLEARVPYLDRTVVEYAQRLDATFKVRHGSRKWLHRRVCEKFLPPKIMHRKKRGFAVNVVDDWFDATAGGELQEILMDDGSMMFELLKPEPVRKLLKAHQSGQQDNHKLLFSLVMLEQWLRGIQSKHKTLAAGAA